MSLAETPVSPANLDAVALLLHAPVPVKVTVAILIGSSVLVWFVLLLKLIQLARMRSSHRDFESRAWGLDAGGLAELAFEAGNVPSGRVVRALLSRETTDLERLRAAAERALVDERRRASMLLSPLGTVAGTAPFIGLFGTVYGIMDAFVRIGAEQSASLPVVAPAIGEALVTTAIGLAAAIPALVFYNALDKRAADYLAELEAAAAEWAHVLAVPPALLDTARDPRGSAAGYHGAPGHHAQTHEADHGGRPQPVYALRQGVPHQGQGHSGPVNQPTRPVR